MPDSSRKYDCPTFEASGLQHPKVWESHAFTYVPGCRNPTPAQCNRYSSLCSWMKPMSMTCSSRLSLTGSANPGAYARLAASGLTARSMKHGLQWTSDRLCSLRQQPVAEEWAETR